MATIVGVVSDTHGLLRPEALDALRGVDRILHAGDIGGGRILERLRQIAPVAAVRGNVDPPGEPERLDVEVEDCAVHVVHVRPARTPRADVVIFGHSHRALVETVRGVLYLNPGSAGPRRFRLPLTVARLYVDGGSARAEIVPLDAG